MGRGGEARGSDGFPASEGRDPYQTCLCLTQLPEKGRWLQTPRPLKVGDEDKGTACGHLGTIDGTGALLSTSIKKAEVLAYEELGTEALRRIEVEDFPVTVINDIYGGDLYEEGKAKYQVKA